MKNTSFPITAIASALAVVTAFSGCGIQQVRDDQRQVTSDTQAQLAAVPRGRPVFQIHEGPWLLGEKVRATKPQPELFSKTVSFKDDPGHASTLTEVVDWIARMYRVRAVVDPSVTASVGASTAATSMSANGATRPVLPAGLATSLTTPSASLALASTPLTPFRFTGDFKEFMRSVEQRYGVYSRYRDGTVTFFKTETRTFTLPDLGEVATMNGTISTSSNGSPVSSAAGSGSSGAGGSSSSASNASGTGGQSATLSVVSDPWLNLEKTARAIAGTDAVVVADKHLGTLTVTGAPAQCDRIEDWVKNLDAMFGKQVAVEVRIYQVRLSQEDNYGLNLSLAYKSGNGHTGATFTGAGVPTVTSSATPMTFGATIVGGKLDGTKAAVQALSTLGNVTQVVQDSGVTQNGKVLALQSATLQDFVQGSQTTLASNVGSTSSIQTATNISGFTSSFRPKVVNGRIVMTFDMTLSELEPLQSFTSGSSTSQSTVQLRTMPLARFEQSVGLRPGESLVLTGLRQQSTSKTNNGIGSPYMALLGGGVDAQKRDTMIAIVITARLL
ncbi:type II secretion system protein GspD [Ralstonia pseudosolanacearum]|uniref:type II secretion system protein GspD n=1 Tax=Ralstonia pseudosolanacearum TaxID=1310165 RepID=UPI0040538B4B